MSKVFISVGDEEAFPLCSVAYWDVDRAEHVRNGRDPWQYNQRYRAVDAALVDRHDELYAEFMAVDARLRRAFRQAKRMPRRNP